MVKQFFSAHKGLHIWLICNGAALGLFWLTRGQRSWMNALTEHVTGPLKQAIGLFCYRFPFSVMEVLIALLVVGCVVWLGICVVGGVRSPRRGHFLYACLLTLLCSVLSIYAGVCLLWGVNYYADSFQDRSGIYAQAVSVEDLSAVADYFAQRLTETADDVVRNADGSFAVPRADIFAASVNAYDHVSQVYPFLQFPDQVPKEVRFSRIMSWMNFTGVFCPFTGESNLNVDSPAVMLPSTIAHELAHQRGVASEQECNFISVLASTTCDNSAYIYSGWLLGYIHLSNALYSADQVAWEMVNARIPDTVRADLRANNAYWKPFSGAATRASQKVYDSFLKGYGESRGIQSYGTVVDLLIVYYKDLL